MLRHLFVVVFAGFFILPATARAHHALAANYEEGNEGTITGVVQEVVFRNPHVRYYLDVDDGNGGTELWDVETQNLVMLGRLGWRRDTISVGDTITVNGVLGRNGTKRISIITVTLANGVTLSPFFSNTQSNRALNDGDAKPDDDKPFVSTAANVLSGQYELDETHAYLTFSYTHMGLSNPVVHFADFDAELALDGRVMANSSVAVTIDAASVDSGVDELDEHFRGEEFFEVATYPTIRFESTSYDELSETEGRLTGDLTVKGTTREITLDVTINKAGTNPMTRKDTVGISASGVISRAAFGLSTYAPLVSDALAIDIQAEFIRADVQAADGAAP